MKEKDWRPIWIYIAVTLLIEFVVGVVGGIIYKPPVDEQIINKLGAIGLIIANAILFIIFVIIYHSKIKEGFKRIDKKKIIFIIIYAILLIGINELVSELFAHLSVETTNQDSIVSYFQMYKIPMILSTVVFAPVIEEFVFRYSLGTLIKNNTVFVIVSAIIFALCHGFGIVTLLYMFIGAALAFIYIKTDKNIMASILVHSLNNLASVLMLLLL